MASPARWFAACLLPFGAVILIWILTVVILHTVRAAPQHVHFEPFLALTTLLIIAIGGLLRRSWLAAFLLVHVAPIGPLLFQGAVFCQVSVADRAPGSPSRGEEPTLCETLNSRVAVMPTSAVFSAFFLVAGFLVALGSALGTAARVVWIAARMPRDPDQTR